MPLDKAKDVANDSLLTPYVTVNNNITPLGTSTFTQLAGAQTSRPASPAIGTFYYDTDTGQTEVYTKNGWVNPATAPNAPINVTAANSAIIYGGTPAAIINFTPAKTGNPATTYTVTSTPGSITATGFSSPIIITGLTAGTSYTYTVTATNTYGSAVSSSSPSLTSGTLSLPPTSVSAQAGNTAATVSFTAPSNTGAAPVTSYTVYSSGGQSATGSSSPIIITGLTNNIAYTFTVVANNNAGSSALSVPSSAITPIPVQPVPLDVLLIGGGGTGGQTFGGGGGAGGVLHTTYLAGVDSFAITVGAGGADAGSVATTPAPSGTNTTIINSNSGTITAYGGGGGGGYAQGSTVQTGTNGGCGGGAGGGYPNTGNPAGGTGSQGGNGGTGSGTGNTGTFAASGGGGGGGNGGGNSGNSAGGGGIGTSAYSTWASATGTGSGGYYAGGGAGGTADLAGSSAAFGGAGGGGNGERAYDGSYHQTAGAQNTGGGGGGGSYATSSGSGIVGGKGGGSGIVIIRYTTGACTATGGTIVNSGGYTYHTFLANGTWTRTA